LRSRSSVAPGRDTRKADPRPIADKSFKNQTMHKLINYLSEHGYERTVSPQVLSAPSVKEFVHIISFLLKATVPNFEFGNSARTCSAAPAQPLASHTPAR